MCWFRTISIKLLILYSSGQNSHPRAGKTPHPLSHQNGRQRGDQRGASAAEEDEKTERRTPPPPAASLAHMVVARLARPARAQRSGAVRSGADQTVPAPAPAGECRPSAKATGRSFRRCGHCGGVGLHGRRTGRFVSAEDRQVEEAAELEGSVLQAVV